MAKSTTALLTGRIQKCKTNPSIAHIGLATHGRSIQKVLVWQRYPGRNSAKSPLIEGRDFVVNETLSVFRHRQVDPVSMPAEDPLFLMYTEWHHRKAEGLSAQHRRVSRLRRGNFEIHPGHPSRGCVLVHGRHRLDHRSFLYRLWAACAGCLVGGVRGSIPMLGVVADRSGARCQYLSHVPDGNPRSTARRA
jgi:hypothetical protein